VWQKMATYEDFTITVTYHQTQVAKFGHCLVGEAGFNDLEYNNIWARFQQEGSGCPFF
jgi:hypothetical protein